MSPSALPWWAWFGLAFVFWFFQLVASIYTDKGGFGAWFFRGSLLAGMVLSAFLGIIRFVKWAWQ
jgi:hypothetical protein